MTIDTSPIGIGWVINQEDSKGKRYAIRFGGKVLQGRQRNYAQIKKELWGIVSTIKDDRDYLIGAEVVIETDCLPILGMISGCPSPDLTMLQWIAYIKSFNPEVQHISGKDNAMAYMLSRARFEDLPVLEDDEEQIEDGFFVNSIENDLPSFCEEDYEDIPTKSGSY